MNENSINKLRANAYLLKTNITSKKSKAFTQEKLEELKETTLEMVRKLEEDVGVKVLESLANDIYERAGKLSRKPIKRVLDMIISYDLDSIKEFID